MRPCLTINVCLVLFTNLCFKAHVAALVVQSISNMFTWCLRVAIIRFTWMIATGMTLVGYIAAFQVVQGSDGTTYSADGCETIRRGIMKVEYCKGNAGVMPKSGGCNYTTRDVGMVLTMYWMASMVWAILVYTNIIIGTIAHSTAQWWPSPGDVEPGRRFPPARDQYFPRVKCIR